MIVSERKELMEALGTIYVSEKANNTVFNKENSPGYSIALGKLQGACMALGLDFEETENYLVIFTSNRRKVITCIEK